MDDLVRGHFERFAESLAYPVRYSITHLDDVWKADYLVQHPLFGPIHCIPDITLSFTNRRGKYESHVLAMFYASQKRLQTRNFGAPILSGVYDSENAAWDRWQWSIDEFDEFETVLPAEHGPLNNQMEDVNLDSDINRLRLLEACFAVPFTGKGLHDSFWEAESDIVLGPFQVRLHVRVPLGGN